MVVPWGCSRSLKNEKLAEKHYCQYLLNSTHFSEPPVASNSAFFHLLLTENKIKHLKVCHSKLYQRTELNPSYQSVLTHNNAISMC